MNRVLKFARDFRAALWHCAFEDMEFFVPVGVIALVLGVFSVLARISYEMLLDPHSADVASRLAQLSIDPARWS